MATAKSEIRSKLLQYVQNCADDLNLVEILISDFKKHTQLPHTDILLPNQYYCSTVFFGFLLWPFSKTSKKRCLNIPGGASKL